MRRGHRTFDAHAAAESITSVPTRCRQNSRRRQRQHLKPNRCAFVGCSVSYWTLSFRITDAWVMNPTTRMGPWQVGHASGSTSNICCRRAAHRRVASLGARRGAGTIRGGVSAAAGSA